MNPLMTRKLGIAMSVLVCAIIHPARVDAQPITQQAYLKPAAVGSTQAVDLFGDAVAVSGDTAVVGAWYEDSSSTGVNSTPNEGAPDAGAAYVYVRSGGVWTQQAYLKPAAVGATQEGDNFGFSVAISGDTIAIGAWHEDGSATGVNGAPDEGAGNSGAVYVFTRSAGVWTQQAYLKPAAVGTTQINDQFGFSVAISGDTLVVGANSEDGDATGVNGTPNDNSSSCGAAYVFTRSAGVWTQQAYLKPAAVGTTQFGDNFGSAVSVDGDTVAVGAFFEDGSGTGANSAANESATDAGAVYIFTRAAGIWSQQAYLKPASMGTTQAGDRFGASVSVSGDTVIVGAPREDGSATGVNGLPDENADESGAAYVFTRSAGVWTQQAYLKPATVGTTQATDRFGTSVAVSGDAAMVGAYQEDSNTTGIDSTANESALDSGAACSFKRSAGAWSQSAYLKPAAVGTSQQFDTFGIKVALDGGTALVGASGESSSTLGVNTTPNEGSVASGAAYVFTGFGAGADGDNDGLLDSWELAYWPTATGHSALDDWDKDGYVELLELALGLNPTVSNPGGLPPLTEEGGYLTMTITKQPGVTYQVQTAGTLVPAQPDSFSTASTTVLINDATTLKVRDNFLISATPRRFIRAQVTAAP